MCNYFQSITKDMQLHDVSFEGHTFTWIMGDLYERLNQAMCTLLDWLHMFSCAHIQHLHFTFFSDHCHILLVTGNRDTWTTITKIWRYERWWMTLPGFKDQQAQTNFSTSIIIGNQTPRRCVQHAFVELTSQW